MFGNVAAAHSLLPNIVHVFMAYAHGYTDVILNKVQTYEDVKQSVKLVIDLTGNAS